jgi:hypothetical protein
MQMISKAEQTRKAVLQMMIKIFQWHVETGTPLDEQWGDHDAESLLQNARMMLAFEFNE